MSAPPRAHRPGPARVPAVAVARSPLARLSRVDRRPLELVFVAALIVAATFLYTLYALRVGGFQPDEWYFTELARMIAHGFPSALWREGVYLRGIARIDQLFLAIPYALFRTPTSYESAHVLQALLWASTALPVWLLARAAGLGRAARALAPVLALLVPWAILSTTFLAEPAAYPAYAWVLYATWHVAARPSRTSEVLALVALVIAALSRTQFLALPPILALTVLWQEWRVGLAGRALGARLRELPRGLWGRYPIVTAVTVVAIVALILSAAGLLPGGGIATLAGDYGLPHLETLSSVLARDRYYASRIVAGTGFIAFALGLSWVLRSLWRPRTPGTHALAVVCVLGIAGLLFSLLQAGGDERYLCYGGIPVILALCAELDSRIRGEGAGLADTLGVAAGVICVILLIESVTWQPIAGPYDYLTYPAGVFFGKVVLGRLSVLHLPLIHPAPERLVQAAIVVVALAWVASGRYVRTRRPAAYVLGALVLGLCAVQLIYSLEQFTTGAAANAGGPSATQRSWVDRIVPAGARVGQLGIGLGATPAYAPIWRTVDFWNTSVQDAAAYAANEMPPVPLGGGSMNLVLESPSGLMHGESPVPGQPPTALPRYLLVPAQGTNPLSVAGTVVGQDPSLPVQLVRVTQPARALWSLRGVTPEGFMRLGQLAVATVYSGALAGANRCASLTLIGPPGFASRWPYAVAGAGRLLAKGSIATQEHRVVTVPLAGIAKDGGRLAQFVVSVNGQVPFVNGTYVSAQVAFFNVGACPRGLR